jgi:hypothetical protein
VGNVPTLFGVEFSKSPFCTRLAWAAVEKSSDHPIAADAPKSEAFSLGISEKNEGTRFERAIVRFGAKRHLFVIRAHLRQGATCVIDPPWAQGHSRGQDGPG